MCFEQYLPRKNILFTVRTSLYLKKKTPIAEYYHHHPKPHLAYSTLFTQIHFIHILHTTSAVTVSSPSHTIGTPNGQVECNLWTVALGGMWFLQNQVLLHRLARIKKINHFPNAIIYSHSPSLLKPSSLKWPIGQPVANIVMWSLLE